MSTLLSIMLKKILGHQWQQAYNQNYLVDVDKSHFNIMYM